MKEQDFRISIKTVWFLAIGNLLLIGFGALAKLQQLESSQVFLTIGLMLLFSTWIIVMGDLLRNRIYNKTFWVVMMIIMPAIAALFYMIQRDKLLRLGQKFS
jgi:hypothetical protein